jgi:hypothetical protein
MQRVESNTFARGFDSASAPAADVLIRERLGPSKCQLPKFIQPFCAKAGTEQPYPNNVGSYRTIAYAARSPLLDDAPLEGISWNLWGNSPLHIGLDSGAHNLVPNYLERLLSRAAQNPRGSPIEHHLSG